MNTKKFPIVLVAFGTTKSQRAYARFAEAVRQTFPEQPVYLALSSRQVRDRRRRLAGSMELPSPVALLTALQEQGWEWAVVQSLHLLAGHEFYRLVQEVQSCSLRTAIGLPLFWGPRDYLAFATAVRERLRLLPPEEALLLVGHGTDHASWATYPALQQLLTQQLGRPVLVGALEGYCTLPEVMAELRRQQIRRVRLWPLMLVAGMHVQQDLAAGEKSWATALTAAGFQVSTAVEGLLTWPEVVALFCRHIAQALDAIPGRDLLWVPESSLYGHALCCAGLLGPCREYQEVSTSA